MRLEVVTLVWIITISEIKTHLFPLLCKLMDYKVNMVTLGVIYDCLLYLLLHLL